MVTTRNVKGSPLTFDEMDTNFEGLELSVSSSVAILQSTIQQAVSGITLSTITGTLDPSRIGPFTDAGVTYDTLEDYLIFLSQKAGSGGTGGPTAPVISAAPTLAFTGGSGDVGENATYTQGTYSSGTVTSRDVQVVVNGTITSTTVGISNGASIAIPTSAGVSPRSFRIIELANWAGGTPVSNPSQVYTINAPGVPVNTTAPVILPSAATELDTLTVTRGAYTVNGSAVNNNTLSFTQRWTADWTLTAALVGATSANFDANWTGTTGSYTVLFSDGSSKSCTLTNGSAAFSWTGAVTATSAVKVQLSTAASLAMVANNIGHVMRYYEIATGSGGAGTETQASNTVTPTDSSAGGAGTVESGHRWLVSLTSAQWSDYQTKRTDFTVTAGRTSQDAETLYNSIPTSGGVTLALGSTAAQINTALNQNSTVFLTAGTYTINTTIIVPANKWLIGLGTGATLNCSTIPTGANASHGIKFNSGSKGVRLNIYQAPNFGAWVAGNGCFWYKVSVEQAGNDPNDHTWAGWYSDPGVFDCVALSCEVLNTQGGGEGDGFRLGCNSGGNITYVDCHAFENDDDGYDVWNSAANSFFHICTSVRNGKNSVLATVGDGNGWKLGPVSVAGVTMFLNKCIATDNGNADASSAGCGYNRNTATGTDPTLRLCTGSGNKFLYYFSNDPTGDFTIVST